jgi:type IV pilus assembly protein PilN
MPRINLLPWREEQRQKIKKDFLAALLGAALIGGLFSYGLYLYYDGLISDQQNRNAILRTEIEELDKQIEEILGLETQRDRLIARMRIIEELQQSRPMVVHLFDELVETLPEGTYLTEVEQNRDRVEVTGIAESSTRVATLMRNIDASEWLEEPLLGGIQAVLSGNFRNQQFTVTADQISTEDDDALDGADGVVQ